MRARARWVSVAAAVSLALTICSGSALAGQGGTRHGRPDNGFARTGPWNTPLPANVPLAPNSAALVAYIQQQQQTHAGIWGVNTDTFSTPIFYVGRHTPVQRWTYSDCLNMPQLAPVIAPSLAAVPTPANLIVSKGTDESTTIYQPSTDTYWDFWRAQKDASGHWSACWGGEIKHYSKNRGIFRNPLGASASGLPLGAFTIRIAELQRGNIDHAINLIIPNPQANCFSWPANRDDGNATGSNIPCEGQRFRLNPSFDVNTLYSPAARTIARAMQKYGLILTDMGGAMVTMAEDPRPYEATHGGVNPYPALMDPGNLLPPGDWQYVLTQIPVDELQALPFNYGKPEGRH
ncbi:MAG TPA: hypothetical protein VF070_22265 [Streptosporangiaceae bacterium]